VPLGIAFGHRGGEHGAGVLAQLDRQVDARQGLGQRPVRHGAAAFHDDDVVGQARDFVGGMADVDQRDVQLVAQALQPGQEFLLAGMVERGQRLVHQQQARRREQGAGDRHALLLAAGKPVGQAVEQRAEAEQVDDGIAS
jgi:hypothetical protein